MKNKSGYIRILSIFLIVLNIIAAATHLMDIMYLIRGLEKNILQSGIQDGLSLIVAAFGFVSGYTCLKSLKEYSLIEKGVKLSIVSLALHIVCYGAITIMNYPIVMQEMEEINNSFNGNIGSQMMLVTGIVSCIISVMMQCILPLFLLLMMRQYRIVMTGMTDLTADGTQYEKQEDENTSDES